MKPHDADLHPPGFTPIATIKGGTVASCNGTTYWLADDGTRTALAKLPKKRLVELVIDEARTVAQLRDGLVAVFREPAALAGRARGLEGSEDEQAG